MFKLNYFKYTNNITAELFQFLLFYMKPDTIEFSRIQ